MNVSSINGVSESDLVNCLRIIFNNNEDELFKRVYVPIVECPSWCQDTLREKRRKRREKLKEKFSI